MKLIKIALVLTAVVLTTASCVEKSAKYQTLLAQRDSLLVVDGDYHQTLEILNDVEMGFQSIRETESTVFSQMQNVEGQPLAKKQQLAGQITQIKDMLAQNKEKIAELQSRLSMSGKNNRALAETIARLTKEQTDKVAQLQSLQAELSRKNIKIEELDQTIVGLNSNVANLNQVSADQKATIATQDQDLNAIWYVVGTAKELKDRQIVSGNGLFKAKTVMDKEFDKTVFAKSDLRALNVIATDSKKPKVLSSHPQESYKLITGDEKLVTLEIIDPAKFWSISKYLVIQK